MRWLGVLALAVASAASAQVEPVASPDDARVAIVHDASSQPVRLATTTGSDLTVLLPASERIQSVTVSDPDAYQVTVAPSQDGLFVRALRTVASASMAVRTQTRLYEIILSPAAATMAPYLVRIDGAETMPRPAVWTPPVISIPGTFKLSGNKALQPVSIHDDGAKIYIEWSGDQAIPAVFTLDTLGREEMVNGYMREQVFTIDRVFDHLVFRIDKAQAAANRIVPKVRK